MSAPARGAALRWLLWRDVTLAWRRRSDLAGALVFFVLVVSLFPLVVGPEAALLRTVGSGAVWIAALLASMLSLSRLFADDLADGTLEQQLLTPLPLVAVVLAKVIAQWVVWGLPLLAVVPLAALLFGLRREALLLTMSLALGTPVVLLVGSIGAALTVGLRGAAALTSLIVMPLFVPVLVFGAGSVQAALWSAPAGPPLRLLAALLIGSLVLAPGAAAAALRISLE
jgi:heme exporter protein B